MVTRRQFITTTSLVALAPTLNACREGVPTSWPTRSHAPPGADDLPPRVVGLRSLGGAFRFDPAGLLIEPDTEVHWLNMGDFHTTTAFHPDNADQLPTEMPLRIATGAESWHSGMIGLTAGTQFTHRFTAEGVYDYFCQPHYGFGMVGRIVVGEPRGGPAVTRPLSELVEVARDKIPTVREINGPAGVTFEWASRMNGALYAAANGRDPRPAAEAVSREMRQDVVLEELATGELWKNLGASLETFTEESSRGDYETLVRRVDEVKALLRTAHGNEV